MKHMFYPSGEDKRQMAVTWQCRSGLLEIPNLERVGENKGSVWPTSFCVQFAMFSLCLYGISPGTQASFLSPKQLGIRETLNWL